MGLFSDSIRLAAEGAQEAPTAGDPVGSERFAKGFELLFGSCFRDIELRLDRLEAESTDRLDDLEKTVLQHVEVLDELADKHRATLEREDDEHRRRKNVEAELRQGIARVQAALDVATEAFRARAGEVEHIRDQQNAIAALSRRLDSFEASRTDRGELAALLTRAAQALAPDAA